MKVQIDEYGFRLRDDTETILYTAQAEQFFKDHNIPYTVEVREDDKVIRYHENNSLIELETVSSIENINMYINKYNMQFTFSTACCKIKFL